MAVGNTRTADADGGGGTVMNAKTYLISDGNGMCVIVGMPDGHTEEDLRVRGEAMWVAGPRFYLTREILEAFGVGQDG
jgi:hypothetical protein